MEPTPKAENSQKLESNEPADLNASRLHEFELLETQQYQVILPERYERLRGYLTNDGLLSDEEITRCLYDESLRRKDLAKRIEECTPAAPETDRVQLTAYLWELHETVKGLPLTFVDPKETYRIQVVDTPDQQRESVAQHQANEELNYPPFRSEVSPVTLHLDINGGFLANFLHNAQLNHEQMGRFITDLERQHRELKAELRAGNTPVAQPAQTPTSLPGLKQTNQEPARSDRRFSAGTQPTGIPPAHKIQTDGAVLIADGPLQPTTQLITNNLKQTVSMNETSTPNVEAPPAGRQTRYQWEEVAAQFEKVGVTRQDLEKAGHLDELLNGRKTGLMKLTQTGEEGKPFQISGKLYIVNTPDKGPIVGIQPERRQLLLPKEFLGYELTTRDRQNLEKNGEMGKRVELTDKLTGKQFAGYVGVDKETKSLTVFRAERLQIPQTVKGVTLTKQQQKNLEQGRAIKLEGMTSNNGQTFNAYVQVSAAKRSLTFAKIPDNVIKQTVDQKTAQDLTRPVHQLKGDGAGGRKTIQPKQEASLAAAQRAETPKSARQQKPTAPKPVGEERRPNQVKKDKKPRLS